MASNSNSGTPVVEPAHTVLDEAHVGDIHGAFGSIAQNDTRSRKSLWARFITLMAIIGPGLIVMVGDNDAGAFGTYTQAGQNYGTTLLWVLLILIPVLYVNQEMVLRLGAVTGVGHARLIFERFGKFWGAFSLIDLLVLNALTMVTEFIGISLALEYLGIPRSIGIAVAGLFIILCASTGNFRRFERIAVVLVLASLTLVPILVFIHPPVTQMAHDFFIPGLPHGKLSEIMLLIIALVGTTVAPWQLFFQQSYVIDKRITPRFVSYERLDLWIGIGFVMIGAIAMIAFTAALFAGKPEFGHFADAGAIARGLEHYFSRSMGVLFAIALIDASIIGAAAVSLSTAYAVGDVLSMSHSLHHKPRKAKGFYAIYAAIIVLGAGLVLAPGINLGLLTNLVQTLSGVLLPSATVFLLLLCNDKAVLGPWVNSKSTNYFSNIIVILLLVLSIILTAAVFFPNITGKQIVWILVCGLASGLVVALIGKIYRSYRGPKSPSLNETASATAPVDKLSWRMPPLSKLPKMEMTINQRIWMLSLRGYLVIAGGMLLYKIIRVAIGH